VSAGRDVGDILRRRAALLAGAPSGGGQASATVQVVVVDIGDGQRYALEARHVLQVQRNVHLRRLPSGAGAVLGVVPLRAGAVPVADLAAVLGVGAADTTRPLVVVLEGEGSPLGLLVDEVSDLTTWRATELEAATGTAGAAWTGARVGPHRTVVLDSESLLDDPRLSPPSTGTAGH
jgi:chemotaxis signal transduction protein